MCEPATTMGSTLAGMAKILVVGAGGIGGTLVGHLAETGLDVTASTSNDSIARAVESQGFRLTGDGNPRSIRARVVVGMPAGEKFDFILLATQPPQVEDAARQAAPHLSSDGRMVVFQNGLCEQRIAEIVGSDKVLGAIVAWGASMPEPGLYDRTSSGGFTIGTIDGRDDSRARQVAQLLEAIGPTTLTDNLIGARWSKLALNAAISSLGTIAGARLGAVVRVRNYRRLALEIFREAVAVAKAENVRLEKVSGTIDLAWMALTDSEIATTAAPSLAAKHAVLLAVGLRYRRLRSSMLSAIERGREPSVDFLNGAIVERGKTHGIVTPVNEDIVNTVKAIARGELKSSRATLDGLFERTRLT